MIAVPREVADTGFLRGNVAAALTYFTIIPAILFLKLMPFKQNHFVRFHAFQSIFLTLFALLAALLLRLAFALLAMIPGFGYLSAWLVVILAVLALFLIWMVAVVKALQGERFKLPLVGGFAERS